MRSQPVTGQDLELMDRAIDLARARIGLTAPNPAVGCVILCADGRIIEGVTGEGGRPHAEELALDRAGEAASGGVLYVTLEPCARRTIRALSCTDRIIAAGVCRVVMGCVESNPRAAGGRFRMMAAGIDVKLGVRETQARALLGA